MDGRLSQLSMGKFKTYTPPPKDALGEKHPLGPETCGAHDDDSEMKVAQQLGSTRGRIRRARATGRPFGNRRVSRRPALLYHEVRDGTDSRWNTEAFRVAKEQEMDVLKKRGTCKIIKEEDLGQNADVLGRRFITAIKIAGTDREQLKALSVGQGFADKENYFLIHNILSLQQRSVRVILSFASNMG